MSFRFPIGPLMCATLLCVACGDDAPVKVDDDGGVPAEPTTALVIQQLPTTVSGMPLSVLLPEDTIGFTVYARVPLQSGIQTLTAPSGAQLVIEQGIPGTAADFQAKPLFTDIPEPVDIAAAVPMTDDPAAMPLELGPWQVVLAEQLGTVVPVTDTRVIARTAVDGTFQGGAIDINLYIAGQSTTSAYMADVLAMAFDDFGGVTLGTVTEFPLDSEAVVISDEQEFRDLLLATPLTAPAPAINILAVGDTNGIGGVGKAGGTPGLALWHGTLLSGIALEVSGDADFDALVLRHEAGHLAGLFHTTEQDDGLTDRLSDTPTCDNVNLFDKCPDAANIMFPKPNSLWSTSFSAQQSVVVQGSALYRDLNDGPTTATASLSPSFELQGMRGLSATLQGALLHICAHHAERTAAVSLAEARQLLDMSADDRMPTFVRKRAVLLAGRSGHELTRIRAMIDDPTAHRAVKIGAIRALQSSDPALLVDVASDDTVIAAVIADAR